MRVFATITIVIVFFWGSLAGDRVIPHVHIFSAFFFLSCPGYFPTKSIFTLYFVSV